MSLIKSDQDKSVLHEVFVVQKRLKEASGPCASNSDRGVVSVASHVGGDKLNHVSSLY